MKKGQSGQFVIEAVLLMLITFMVSTALIQFFNRDQFLNKLVLTPWEVTTGMIECGTWQACGPGKPGLHPNKLNRNLSLKPE